MNKNDFRNRLAAAVVAFFLFAPVSANAATAIPAEIEDLITLGNKHIGKGKLEMGLRTLGVASKLLEGSGQADAVRHVDEAMSAVFIKLYLQGGADTIAPGKAIDLYYEFRQLTPSGKNGDKMIQNLVELLASENLHIPAAKLLTHQITYRLDGTEKQRISVRLAKIYSEMGEPDKSLGVLRKTETDKLSTDLRRQHDQLVTLALKQGATEPTE